MVRIPSDFLLFVRPRGNGVQYVTFSAQLMPLYQHQLMPTYLSTAVTHIHVMHHSNPLGRHGKHEYWLVRLRMEYSLNKLLSHLLYLTKPLCPHTLIPCILMYHSNPLGRHGECVYWLVRLYVPNTPFYKIYFTFSAPLMLLYAHIHIFVPQHVCTYYIIAFLLNTHCIIA